MDLKEIDCASAVLSSMLHQYSSRAEQIAKWLANKIIYNQQYEQTKSVNYRLCKSQGIPVPGSKEFSSTAQLAGYLNAGFPSVVKFDTTYSLGGQTVIVNSPVDFKTVIESAQCTRSTTGIIQEFIAGQEYTVVLLVGKHNWVRLGTAVDYKKQLDGNQGLNTFGSGSVGPCSYVSPKTDLIINKVVEILQERYDYTGPLACQFLLEPSGQLWLMEWNTRFCDPEFQSIAECLDHTTIQAVEQMVDGLRMIQPTIHNQNAVTIALAHQDWPMPQSTRAEITFDPNPFRVYQCVGKWSRNCYWGSITNSGSRPHSQLAKEIYNFLATQHVAPYRYRSDIAD